MLQSLKDLAAKQLGKVLTSEATMRVLNSAELRGAVVTAINLRAGAREVLEARVKELATALELVTRQDLAHLRRSMRDLEDHIAELRDQLDQAQQELAASKAAEEQAKAQAEAAVQAASQESAAAPAAPTPEAAEGDAQGPAETATAKKPRKAKAS